MSLLWVYYHGYVDIAYWEYSLGAAFLVVVYVIFARQKNVAIKKHPEYKHFLWGLYAKIIGGVAFSLIYFYYYSSARRGRPRSAAGRGRKGHARGATGPGLNT